MLSDWIVQCISRWICLNSFWYFLNLFRASFYCIQICGWKVLTRLFPKQIAHKSHNDYDRQIPEASDKYPTENFLNIFSCFFHLSRMVGTCLNASKNREYRAGLFLFLQFITRTFSGKCHSFLHKIEHSMHAHSGSNVRCITTFA